MLAWCIANPGCEAVLDDRAARKCSSALGIPARGILGVLLAAKRAGRIGRVEPLFGQLIECGLRIHPAILGAALGLAGEEPAQRG